ncbi:MAG: hypothetical protein JWR20_408 [Marmoricola sp.]|nr:hypothetical protein [Marmoricola sp.]
MTRRVALVGGALAAVTALTGCGGASGSHAAAASSSSPSSTSAASTSGGSSSGGSSSSGSASGGSTSAGSASASKSTGASTQAASPAYAPASTALGTGQRVWAAFSHRGLTHDQWWAGLRPLLSEAARATYVYDDPRNLPRLDLAGRIRVAAKAPSDPHFTAAVLVPTSKGVFQLDLERHDRRSPWLLYAIRFPRSVT